MLKHIKIIVLFIAFIVSTQGFIADSYADKQKIDIYEDDLNMRLNPPPPPINWNRLRCERGCDDAYGVCYDNFISNSIRDIAWDLDRACGVPKGSKKTIHRAACGFILDVCGDAMDACYDDCSARHGKW